MTDIPRRTKSGLKAYLQGCERSIQEKSKIIPFVRGGKIVELGCGNGVVLDLVSRAFPNSKIEGFEISKKIAKKAQNRKYINKNVKVFVGDATKKLEKDDSCDTVILCSTLHEIYSFSGERNAIKALELAYKMLKKDGRLIIRDGFRPEKETVYLELRSPEAKEKFFRFAKDFKPYKIKYKKMKDGRIEMSNQDLVEFLSKYFYDTNWGIETKEQFGIFTLKEYHSILKKMGFQIVQSSKYLLPFLLGQYEKDVTIFKKVGKVIVESRFPESTILLVGKKV